MLTPLLLSLFSLTLALALAPPRLVLRRWVSWLCFWGFGWLAWLTCGAKFSPLVGEAGIREAAGAVKGVHDAGQDAIDFYTVNSV